MCAASRPLLASWRLMYTIRAELSGVWGVKRVIAVVAALLLVGCASSQLNNGLHSLLGQRIEAARAHLGNPDGRREIMGDTIYIWSTNRAAITPFVDTPTTTGMVGNMPVHGTTSPVSFVPVQAQCTIQIAVSAYGIIKQYQWQGNEMGCRGYAKGFPG